MSSYFDLHDCCILELSDEHRKRSRNGAVHHEEEHCHRYRRHRIHHRYRHCRSSRMRYDYLERSTYPTRHLCRNDFRRIPRSHGIAASLNTITNENETERGTHEHRAPLHFFLPVLLLVNLVERLGAFLFDSVCHIVPACYIGSLLYRTCVPNSSYRTNCAACVHCPIPVNQFAEPVYSVNRRAGARRNPQVKKGFNHYG